VITSYHVTMRDPRPILPQALRRRVAIVSVLATLLVATLAVTFAGDTAPAAFDRAVLLKLDSLTPSDSAWLRAIGFAGGPVGLPVLVALLVGVSLVVRRPRMAVLVVLGTGLSISVTTALKPLVGRTIDGIYGIYLTYPSGHTASATALAMIAALLVWHRLSRAAALALLYGVALTAGAAAAWAQAVLENHYASDTVGGWCIVLAVVPATAWLVDYAAARWLVRKRRITRLTRRAWIEERSNQL
jgi:membrane-associated phospholipid phosphatase